MMLTALFRQDLADVQFEVQPEQCQAQFNENDMVDVEESESKEGQEAKVGRKKARVEVSTTAATAQEQSKAEEALNRASATATASKAESKQQHSHKYVFHKREHAKPAHPTGKEKRLLSHQRITQSIYADPPCCSLRCSRHFDFDAVVQLREMYVGLGTEKARTQRLVELLVSSGSQSHAKSGQHSVFASMFGKGVCREGFTRAFGVSKDKIRRAVREWRSGHLLPPVHRGVASDHARKQSEFVESALTRLFETICDDVPSASGATRIMTMWRSWRWVADWVAAEWYASHGLSVPSNLLADAKGNTATAASTSASITEASSSSAREKPVHPSEGDRVLKPPSVATVNRVRRALFANVTRPRKGALPACPVCVALMAERERGDPSQRAKLNEQMKLHGHDHRRVRVLLQREIDDWLAAGDTVVMRVDYTTNAKIPHFRAPPQVSIADDMFSLLPFV